MKYETPDLYLAAYLKAKNQRLKVEQRNKRCFFIFDKHDKTEDMVDDFYNNEPVKVTDYKNALLDLKSMIHRGA